MMRRLTFAWNWQADNSAFYQLISGEHFTWECLSVHLPSVCLSVRSGFAVAWWQIYAFGATRAARVREISVPSVFHMNCFGWHQCSYVFAHLSLSQAIRGHILVLFHWVCLMMSVCGQWSGDHIVLLWGLTWKGVEFFRKACDNRAVVRVSIKLLDWASLFLAKHHFSRQAYLEPHSAVRTQECKVWNV